MDHSVASTMLVADSRHQSRDGVRSEGQPDVGRRRYQEADFDGARVCDAMADRHHHVEAIPLTPENVRMCAGLCADRQAYGPGELDEVLDSASVILHEGRGHGAIVVEDGTPRAFGMSVFAGDAFIDQYLNAPHPLLGKRLLLEAHDPARSHVLRVPDIAQGNAGRGLQLVIVNAGQDPAAHDPDAVRAAMMTATVDAHRGYRIARIVKETFGEAGIHMMTASAAYEAVASFDVLPDVPLRSLLGVVTRERAAAMRSPLLPMFAYNTPRLMLTGPERELLSEALSGVTDETISARLGIPLTAVRARWTRIHHRAAETLPMLFSDLTMPSHDGHGVRARQLILDFVRRNPSELTPYAAARVRAKRQRVT